MKKENFITLAMGTVGGLLFALGMCMCMLPEWNAFQKGIAVGSAGLAVLLAMPAVRRRMQGKPPVKLRSRTAGVILLGVAGVLALGAGMCMTMVWEGLLVQGILAGVAGIAALLCLIPLCKGLK